MKSKNKNQLLRWLILAVVCGLIQACTYYPDMTSVYCAYGAFGHGYYIPDQQLMILPSFDRIGNRFVYFEPNSENLILHVNGRSEDLSAEVVRILGPDFLQPVDQVRLSPDGNMIAVTNVIVSSTRQEYDFFTQIDVFQLNPFIHIRTIDSAENPVWVNQKELQYTRYFPEGFFTPATWQGQVILDVEDLEENPNTYTGKHRIRSWLWMPNPNRSVVYFTDTDGSDLEINSIEDGANLSLAKNCLQPFGREALNQESQLLISELDSSGDSLDIALVNISQDQNVYESLLSTPDIDETQPVWHPNGAMFAYVGLFENGNNEIQQDIFIYNLVSGSYENITNSPLIHESQPRWSTADDALFVTRIHPNTDWDVAEIDLLANQSQIVFSNKTP